MMSLHPYNLQFSGNDQFTEHVFNFVYDYVGTPSAPPPPHFSGDEETILVLYLYSGKGKAIPLQAWTGP
jgi:hypothetical protein